MSKPSKHAFERRMTGAELTAEEVVNLTAQDIVQVYSGKPNCCCCGCAGTYRVSSRTARLAGDIEPTEVNDAQVNKVLKLIRLAIVNGEPDVEFGTNYVSVVVGSRLYIAYPFKAGK